MTLTAVFLLLLSLFSLSSASAVDVFEAGGAYACIKGPALTQTSNYYTVMAFAQAKRGSCSDTASSDLVLKRSTDLGATWTDLSIVYTDPNGGSVGTPAPFQIPSKGRIMVPFTVSNTAVYVTYTDDQGVTWSAASLLQGVTKPDWSAVALGQGGIFLRMGRILVPGYHKTNTQQGSSDTTGHTMYSQDYGVTWALGGDFGASYSVSESQMVELSSGHVLVNGRTLSGKRYQAVSVDQATSFGNEGLVQGLKTPNVGCEGSLVIDTIRNTTFYSGPTEDGWSGLTIFSSKDDGNSYQAYQVVEQGSSGFSAMHVLAAGQGLAILYETGTKISYQLYPSMAISEQETDSGGVPQEEADSDSSVLEEYDMLTPSSAPHPCCACLSLSLSVFLSLFLLLG